MANEIELKFNFQPREWQKKCLSHLKRFSVLAVHRRAGKTTLAINTLVIKSLDKVGLYAYIAPELKQAKLIAWKALKDICLQFQNIRQGKQIVNLCEFRESELIVRFWNGSEIRLFGADNPDSLRGAKLAGAVIDEVAQMPKELWLEIVYPALMDSKGFSLFIGTPKGINLFSELYEKGKDENFKEAWSSQKFTCYETDALSPEDIELYKQSVPEEVFNREMLCDFTASGSNQLISLFDAVQASHKSIDENFLGNAPLVMGVDVARFGDDKSTLVFRKGLLTFPAVEVKGLDLVHLSDVIINYIVDRNPTAVFVDGTGVGGGVVDLLNNKIASIGLSVFIYDINFGRKSAFANYANKRAEMWGKMSDWIKKGGIIPDDESFVRELSMPQYDVDEKGVLSLESKKQIRQRLGKSPDKADALALTFADEVVTESIRGFDSYLRVRQRNHNPFDFERELNSSPFNF